MIRETIQLIGGPGDGYTIRSECPVDDPIMTWEYHHAFGTAIYSRAITQHERFRRIAAALCGKPLAGRMYFVERQKGAKAWKQRHSQ